MTNGIDTHFQIGGVCRIADIPFVLSAAFSESGELICGGRLSPDTVLSIDDLLDRLGKQFGMGQVPQPIHSLALKGVGFSYATSTDRLTFNCTGSITFSDVQVEMSVCIAMTRIGEQWQFTFSGSLLLNKLLFDVVFDTCNWERNIFLATYHSITEKDQKGVSLRQLVGTISSDWAQSIPPSFVVDLQEVKFVFYGDEQQKIFLFGMQLSTSINLKEIPVAGDQLPDNIRLGIRDLQILFTSGDFTSAHIGILNPLLPSGILEFPDRGIPAGILITGLLQVCDYTLPIDTGGAKDTSPAVTYTEPFVGYANNNPSATVSPDSISWFNVEKKLGPLYLRRLGLAFADNTLSFALDASLVFGPAELSLTGLTLGSSLSEFRPVFGLQGFFLSMKSSGFELRGGFLRASAGTYDAYYGVVMAAVASLRIQALGGYIPAHQIPGDENGDASQNVPACFFIYANVELPLGGPPYFQLQGFAGGFGINNSLILPTLNELPEYILLPGPKSKAPKQEATPEATIRSVLPQMQNYFVSQAGQYWAAAGIAFSSFQMIEAFALVTVSFGVDLRIALLGTCSMTFPKGTSHPVAYIEIIIMASYARSTGLLAVEGIITPASYVFGSFCRVTGGFAFYIWIDPPVSSDGPHAGDFLVSLGGYHPDFNPPSYYPKLPRIGIRFNLSALQVVGEAYFALTPSLLMAGGKLQAVWELGIIRAWFAMGIDFIMAWAPFSYAAKAYVCIGCSVNLGLFTLKVSISAYLDIWGPPFGGIATVDLGIVSFEISFGGKKPTTTSLLDWQEFRTQFLPADTADSSATNQQTVNSNTTQILKATVVSGLHPVENEADGWIIDSDHFAIRVSTLIPANTLQIGEGDERFREVVADFAAYNDEDPPVDEERMPYLVFRETEKLYNPTTVWNPEVHIKPMGKNAIQSVFDVVLHPMDAWGEYTGGVVALTVSPIVEQAAGALWNPYTSDTRLDEAAFLRSALTGAELSPIPRRPSLVNNVPIVQLMYQQNNRYYFGYESEKTDRTFEISSRYGYPDVLDIRIYQNDTEVQHTQDTGYVLASIHTPWVVGRRNLILRNLENLGFDVYSEAELSCFSTQTVLMDWPTVLKLGDTL